MDKSQKEFTELIRSAIKAKLTEINAFVDDELPDYIMILVANKRSKSQIGKDLSLFLGEDTLKFTDWLWDMVKSYKFKGKLSVSKKDEVKKKIEKDSEEDNDVLDCDVSEHGSDILDEDANSQKKVKIESTRVKDVSLPHKVSKGTARSSSDQEYPNIPFLPSLDSADAFLSEDEYDPTKPHFSGCISSVVQVSQKSYPRPVTLQPNKLLLRAVNDATKSVMHGQNINDYYKPTPIDVLSSNKKQSHSRCRTLVNVKIDPDIEYPSEANGAEENFFDPAGEDLDLYNMTHGCAISNPSPLTLNPESSDTAGLNETVDYFHVSESETLDPKGTTPHFIVTLDGVDYSLKRKYSEDSDEAMEVDEDKSILPPNEDSSSGFKSKKQKRTQKCKFWPSCFKSVEECDYFHPTVPCKIFPECKYGDQCMYIHPDCKFDSRCSKKDCPFTHASKRKFSFTPAPKVASKKKWAQTACKFYPKCTASNCAFFHPKPCRYGTQCRSSVCPFSHSNIPARNQLIWKANA